MDIKSIIVLAGILLCCTAEAIVSIDLHKAKDLLNLGYRYLDVRPAEEYNEGHIDFENTFNVPYTLLTPEGRVKNPQFLEQVLASFNKNDKLIVGCQLGIISVQATTDLENAGFKHISNMEGGYKAWIENGFDAKKSYDEL